MTPPPWVLAEIERREAEARAAYATARASIRGEVPEKFIISEDEYVRRYLASMPGITWTSGGIA